MPYPCQLATESQLLRQLALRQTIETRTLKRKLAIQRSAIQKTRHPGTWRHFVASRAASATPARFDFYGDGSGNAAAPTKKGSCEMQQDGAQIPGGDPKTVQSTPLVDVTS